jgi:hypothetical protein
VVTRANAALKPFMKSSLALVLLLAGFSHLLALEYLDTRALEQRFEKLSGAHRKLVNVGTLAKTSQKRTVWLVELGSGTSAERAKRPALLAIAGIEGNDLAGPSILAAWAEQFLTNNATRELLESTTIYLVPRVNPDAAESFFKKPRVEQAVNFRPVDDDHDGMIDEDGPEDLNGDGLITSMRVQEPEGDYILDPSDPRLLLKADRPKGEAGAWRLLTEGGDNDNDEAWNEDGPGGVNLNRNFPYNYKFFGGTSGLYPMSEPETRALAEFVVAHPNIGVVFTFGAADNLSASPKADSAGASRRPPTAMQDDDIAYYRELGKLWREALGLKKELSAASEPGTFSDWIYFHRGRLSLAARPWSPALQMELARKSDKPDEKKDKDEKEKKPEPDKRNEEDRALLKWLTDNSPESFVQWKAYDHPDFPGKKVEIGGFAPFAKSNPPTKNLEELAAKHGKFLTELASKFPRLALRKSEIKSLGNQVYDITLQIENTGYLPTSLAQGTTTREVHPIRVILNLPDAAILSGTRITMLPPIEGSGGMREVRYVVYAKNKTELEIEVVSAFAGSFRKVIDLKEAR